MTQNDTQRDLVDSSGEYPQQWNTPQPEKLAEPTYWPMVLSVGITVLAWGAVTSYLLSLLGLGMSIVAIINWIGDIRREQRPEVEE